MRKSNHGPRLSGAPGGLGTLLASMVCILAGLAVGFAALLGLGGITMGRGGGEFTFASLLKITWEQGFKPILQGGF